MPIYVYKVRDTGEEVERFYHHHEPPPHILLDDLNTVADRVLFPTSTLHRLNPHGRGHQNRWGQWPILSDGLGCAPDQIPEFRTHAGCDFTPEGQAILESPQHQKKVARLAGLEVK